MNTTDVFSIEHFGVKGMRWGVRKKRLPQNIKFSKTDTTLKKGKTFAAHLLSKVGTFSLWTTVKVTPK